MDCHLPKLRLLSFRGQPTLKNSIPHQELDPPHRHLPLLLLRLVVIGPHKDLTPSLTRAEEGALLDQAVGPVPDGEIVAIHYRTKILSAEKDLIGGGRVAETR